jgi:hypothetical protein
VLQPPLVDAVEVPIELGSAQSQRGWCQEVHRLTTSENEPDSPRPAPSVGDHCLHLMPGNPASAAATNDRGLSRQINAKSSLPLHACNLGAAESQEEQGAEHAMIAPQKDGSNCEPAHAHRQSQHSDVARHADLDLRLGRTVLKGHDVCRSPKLFAGLPGTQPGPRAGTVLIVAHLIDVRPCRWTTQVGRGRRATPPAERPARRRRALIY